MDRVVEHRGCTLAYDLCGNGPNVLFIQGAGVHGAGWETQVTSLSADFTCSTFDNRGIGRSQPAVASMTLEGLADDAAAVMDAAAWDRAHVVGHSMGGLIAVYLALAARHRVRSLSLLCTFARGGAVAPMPPRMIWHGARSRIGSRAMRRKGFLGLLLPPGGCRARTSALSGSHRCLATTLRTSHRRRGINCGQ